MALDWINALKAVIEGVERIAGDYSALRSDLRALAQAILEATEPGTPTVKDTVTTQEPVSSAPVDDVPPAVQAAQEDGRLVAETPPPTTDENKSETPTPEVAAPLPAPIAETKGNGTILLSALPGPPPAPQQQPAPAGPAFWESRQRIPMAPWAPTTDADLPDVEARCRLKAEAVRWTMSRQHLLREGAKRSDIEPRDQEIIKHAKQLPDCFLWMIYAPEFSPTKLAFQGNLAGCFDTVANAVALLREIIVDLDGTNEVFERGLHVLAEAQSALRAAIDAVPNGPAFDPDQKKVYDWLRATAGQRQIFISRYMRGEDRADPFRWESLMTRIENLREDHHQLRKRDKQRKKLFEKARFELGKGESDLPEDEKNQHWRNFAAAVDTLVQGGLPASNRDLRELILPVFDGVPDLEDFPGGFRLVLREVDRFLAARQTTEPEEAGERELAPEVKEAATLLQGQSIVLIGGNHRPKAKEALKKNLGLKELYWVQIDEYQSLDTFEPYIAQPDVAVVILAIRWSRHCFGEAQRYCERYGKPLVRLPAGYNSNQVAAQILAQCSDRLAAKAIASEPAN
ncbi:MAG TPA: hypothetical protein VKE98_22015 [Gemmataceae bacterium]|nr:hypothetical protein [Gemmataceae bacterium]